MIAISTLNRSNSLSALSETSKRIFKTKVSKLISLRQRKVRWKYGLTDLSKRWRRIEKLTTLNSTFSGKLPKNVFRVKMQRTLRKRTVSK